MYYCFSARIHFFSQPTLHSKSKFIGNIHRTCVIYHIRIHIRLITTFHYTFIYFQIYKMNICNNVLKSQKLNWSRKRHKNFNFSWTHRCPRFHQPIASIWWRVLTSIILCCVNTEKVSSWRAIFIDPNVENTPDHRDMFSNWRQWEEEYWG